MKLTFPLKAYHSPCQSKADYGRHSGVQLGPIQGRAKAIERAPKAVAG